MKIKPIKWLLVLLIGMTACYDYSNFENIALEPFSTTYVFPVVDDSITLKEILERSDSISMLQENPDHSFSILFQDTLDAGFATDQYDLPNQNFDESFSAPISVPVTLDEGDHLGPYTQNFEKSITSIVNTGGTVALKEIDFATGSFEVRLLNNFNHRISGDLIISSLKDNQGDSLKITFDLSGYGSQYVNSYNLSNYHFDCYNKTTQNYNTFTYVLKDLLITSSGTPINPGDNVDIEIRVTNPSFESITGKINYEFVQNNQSYNIDLFQAASNVQQHLEDPKLSIQLINTYGIPISITFNQFRMNNKDNNPFSLTSTRSEPGDLQIPNIANNITRIQNPGQQPAITTFVLNRDNSNIENAFDQVPTSIDFGATFTIGDNTNNHDYFITQSSEIKLISEAEIPVYGWASITLTDTLDNLNLTDLDSMDIRVDDADITLSLKISNQIPFSIYAQASFLNDADQVLTTLFDGVADKKLIASPSTGTDGISNSTAVSYTDIRINKSKYELMADATKMVISYKFMLGEVNDPVKILSTNTMGIEASIRVAATIKPEL